MIHNEKSRPKRTKTEVVGSVAKETGKSEAAVKKQVQKAAKKQIEGYTYRELAFHLSDSRVYRKFCKIGIDRTFKKSALQKGIKALTEGTWEQINRAVIEYSDEQGIEKGRKIRIDCTVVESYIHDPYDSELLVDGIRVLARILATAKAELPGIVFTFSDHLRRAKRRNLEIMNAKNVEQRKKPYKDIIELAEKTIDYSEKGLKALALYAATSLKEQALIVDLTQQLFHY